MYAWETLLSRIVSIIASMSSTANRYTKTDGMVRVVVFRRYAALGASAAFAFRLHLLAVLHVCVNIHAYDFNFEELCMLIILSKILGI